MLILSLFALTFVATPSIQFHAPSTPNSLAVISMGRKTTWSIGKSRRKPAKTKVKPSPAPAAKGFGPPATNPVASKLPALQRDTEPAGSVPAGSSVSPVDANDLAAVAAAAGGDVWRAYADRALEQVQQLEAQAAKLNCSPQDLLRKSSAE